jgi:hypothetical protein
MSKYIRYAAAIIVVLAILVTADYFIVKQNPDVLGYSLDQLGERLIDMVPEGKEAVQGLFDQFVSRVQAEEVSPDQVEQVAANILNLKNQNATLTPEQAESVISFTLYTPEPPAPVVQDSIRKQKRLPFGPSRRKLRPPRERIALKSLERLGERLKVAFECNDRLQETFKDARNIQNLVRFEIADGLRLAIDSDLKGAIAEGEFEDLASELRHLEKQEMVVWQLNLAHEAQKRMEHRQKELESIHELRKLEHLAKREELKALKELESLELLKNLEVLGFVPNFNSDSLHIVIEKRVKEAVKQEEQH